MQPGIPRSEIGSEPRRDQSSEQSAAAESNSATSDGHVSSSLQNKKRSGIITSHPGSPSAHQRTVDGKVVRSVYDGPDRRAEGKTNKSVGATPAAARVEYDSHGRVNLVVYPSGLKERTFERDIKGEVISITTRDAEGVRTINYASGYWFTNIEGQHVKLPGNIYVNNRGDFSTQLSADGIWRTERPDGSIVEERSTAVGARISFDGDRRLQHIVRKDGSWISVIYREGAIQEILEAKSQNSSIIRWKPDSPEPANAQGQTVWRSSHEKPLVRLNLTVHDNANTSWTDLEGLRQIVRGNGVVVTEQEGGFRLLFDAQGRIETIEYARGQRIRKFAYEQWTTEINTVTLIDANKGARIYKQIGPDNWLVTDDSGKKYGSWRGQVQLSDDGTYGVKNLRAASEDRFGHWKTYRTDGTEAREFHAADGARAIYDTSGRLQTIFYANGLRVDAHYSEGKLNVITELAPGGTVSGWRKGDDSVWRSDNTSETRKNLGFNKCGEMYFLDAGGRQHTILTSGLEQIRLPNGSTLICDSSGLILQTHSTAGEKRLFGYDENQRLIQVTSNTVDGGTDVWHKKSDDNIEVTADGDICVKTADGSVIALEKSNFERVDFDGCGQVVKVTLADGTAGQTE